MIFIGLIVFFAWFFLPIIIVSKICDKFMSLQWNVDNLVPVLIITKLINMAFIAQVLHWLNII